MGIVLLADCKKCENKVQCALEEGNPIKVDFGWEKENMKEACDTCWSSHEVHMEINCPSSNVLNKTKVEIL